MKITNLEGKKEPMIKQKSRRSDEEIIAQAKAEHKKHHILASGEILHSGECINDVVIRAAPELKKQANLKLLNEIKNEVKERFQDRTRLGETAANHEDRLADAAYLNALSGLWDWLEAKRRELEK